MRFAMRLSILLVISGCLIPALAQSHPIKASRVLAKSLGPVPGAIVCADLHTAQKLYAAYGAYFSDHLQDVLTGGQSELLRPSVPRPNPVVYGCVLIKPQTVMLLKGGTIVPVVRVDLPRGKTVIGVTLPGMYYDPTPLPKATPFTTQKWAAEAAKAAPEISKTMQGSQVILSSADGECGRIRKDGDVYKLLTSPDPVADTQSYADYYLALVNGYQQCDGIYRTNHRNLP